MLTISLDAIRILLLGGKISKIKQMFGSEEGQKYRDFLLIKCLWLRKKIQGRKQMEKWKPKSCVYGVGGRDVKKRRGKKKRIQKIKTISKGLLFLFEQFKNIFIKQHCFSLGFVLFSLPFYTVVCSLFCILVLQGEFCLTRHQENCQLCQSAVITRARDQKRTA